jgi:hypothetical protein
MGSPYQVLTGRSGPDRLDLDEATLYQTKMVLKTKKRL